MLSGPITSPTLRAQLSDWLAALPGAHWHQYQPGDAGQSARVGSVAAFGQPVQSVLHLDRARCVLALGSDPFSDGPGALRQAADWARVRQAGKAPELWALEASPVCSGRAPMSAGR